MTKPELQPQEVTTEAREPKDFREGRFGHFPNRIVEETRNVIALKELIREYTTEEPMGKGEVSLTETKRDLEDAVLYDCLAKIFPRPDSASDFIPVIDPKSIDLDLHPELKGVNFTNSIALIMINNQLAVVGGFNDCLPHPEAKTQQPESPAKTAAREANEELGINSIRGAAMIGKASKSIRDPRKAIDSTIFSGVVSFQDLRPGDDAKKGPVIVVKLINEDGTLNTSFYEPEIEHTDLKGTKFTHQGWRADHKFTYERLGKYWKKYGEPRSLTLDQTLIDMSEIFPQDWFAGYEKHLEGTDDYPKIKVEKRGEIDETPNIEFALKTFTQIFTNAGYGDAERRAERFVYDCVEVGVLPLFPQASVAVDCVVVDGNYLLLETEEIEGIIYYKLPGSFFSPDPDDPQQRVIGMDTFGEQTVFKRMGIDVRVDGYLITAGGTDATGELVDIRFPRTTNAVMARPTGVYRPKEGVVRLKIRSENGEMSKELREASFLYGHKEEIVEYFFRFLKHFDPQGKKTAEDIVRDYSFAYSFGP